MVSCLHAHTCQPQPSNDTNMGDALVHSPGWFGSFLTNNYLTVEPTQKQDEDQNLKGRAGPGGGKWMKCVSLQMDPDFMN